MAVRHFLTLNDLTAQELGTVIDRAIELKNKQKNKQLFEPFKNHVMAMIFEKSSTRTRVSFETAMTQLGGSAIFLSSKDSQLGRGEPVDDTARVLSRMVDIIMIRTFDHSMIEKFSNFSQVPVINALTDYFHPCQLLADIQTFVEHRGDIKGKKVAWIGDGNNMCNSYINAAVQFDFELSISCPDGYEPLGELTQKHKNRINIVREPKAAVKNADMVVTDVWASMGQESEQKRRLESFKHYQVSPSLMDHANEDALFMHCLPAHRGEEISADMLDDPRSIVWDEAENRLHSQKALIEFLLNNSS